MKYKVQEYSPSTKEFIVYMVASNGELCKQVATCRDEKDANLICSMLNEKQAVKNA